MAARSAPRHADAGQRETFRELLTSRAALYSLVIGSAAVVVFAAYRGQPLMMLWGPLIVLALVASVCAFFADRIAAQRFFSAYARSVGLDYAPRWQLLELTPLLGAGDRRWCEHWMSGVMLADPRLTGGLGHYTFQRRAKWSEDELGVRNTHEVTHEQQQFTLAVVDVEAALPLFHGVFLHPRRGLVDHFRDWLDHPPAHETEVESAAFTQRYQLRLADEQDELLARQLLTPSLVEWLSTHPLTPGFELRGGTLVVFTQRVLQDAGNLTFFLEGVRELARRVLREVGEAHAATPAPPATAAAPVSIPPPGGGRRAARQAARGAGGPP